MLRCFICILELYWLLFLYSSLWAQWLDLISPMMWTHGGRLLIPLLWTHVEEAGPKQAVLPARLRYHRPALSTPLSATKHRFPLIAAVWPLMSNTHASLHHHPIHPLHTHTHTNFFSYANTQCHSSLSLSFKDRHTTVFISGQPDSSSPVSVTWR